MTRATRGKIPVVIRPSQYELNLKNLKFENFKIKRMTKINENCKYIKYFKKHKL